MNEESMLMSPEAERAKALVCAYIRENPGCIVEMFAGGDERDLESFEKWVSSDPKEWECHSWQIEMETGICTWGLSVLDTDRALDEHGLFDGVGVVLETDKEVTKMLDIDLFS